MNAPDHRQRRILTFLTIGDEEASTAGMILKARPRQAAFFQQQAAEKFIRTVLEAEHLVAGPTHNLRTLIDLLPPNHALRSSLLRVEDLTSAATRF